ncbi:MAG TPA: hypothetical protein ENJ32_12940 [Crenotrichaceae bacterium]|nr:hypothetical protein [Crenotrichaceae bacterium]
MLKNRVVSGLLLLIFIGLSYFVLIRYVTPLVVETTTSDLFLEDTGDYRTEGPANTAMTETASNVCFDEIIAQHDEIVDIDISRLKHTVWPLGGFRYIIKSTIPANQSSDNTSHIMVCEVTYDHTTDDPNTLDNWTITGMSYNSVESDQMLH